MTSEAEDASSSGAAAPEITEVVSQTTRSCRGCLYYSSILREHGRNPICLGLSRSSEPQVYAVQNEMDKEVTKNFRKFSDFKYACIGYSAHKELSSNQTSSSSSSSSSSQQQQQQQQQQRIDGPGELPYCVGLEFLADRKPTRQGVPAHRPVATSNPPPMIPERPHRADGPTAMPRPPSSIGGLGGGSLSGDEFATRFFRTSKLVAAAVVNNVTRVANSVRTTIDEIFTSDQGRPKS